MNWRARPTSRLATAATVALPGLEMAFQFFRAIWAVPRMPQRTLLLLTLSEVPQQNRPQVPLGPGGPQLFVGHDGVFQGLMAGPGGFGGNSGDGAGDDRFGSRGVLHQVGDDHLDGH